MTEKEKELIMKNVLENMLPLHKFIGVKVLEIGEGIAKLHFPYREEMIGDPVARAIHGGIIAMALDSAGGAAGLTTLTSFEDKLSTIDLRIDYLRPGKPEDIIAEAKIVRSGNRIIVIQMWAYHGTKDYLIAEGKGVFNVRRKKDKELEAAANSTK